MSDFLSRLDSYLQTNAIDLKLYALIKEFYDSYQHALKDSSNPQKDQDSFELLIQLIIKEVQHPHTFSIFHQSIRKPFDYYQFGLDFMRPFVNLQKSKIFGTEFLPLIEEQLKKGENVILLANHQTEPDPQLISLLLEKTSPKLGQEMVFVAGHRVISDPMAIPMSLGRNLLCIYSKKHMDHPLEEKAQKILHNQKTLKKMQELLNEGGYCIYVAPSGGRDRINEAGEIEVAPFDPQSIELFWLMGKNAEKPTHFYPLALQTYHLMPPPLHVEKEVGEKRVIHITPIFLAFGKEISMEKFPGSEGADKRLLRSKRADYIWKSVCDMYQAFPANGRG